MSKKTKRRNSLSYNGVGNNSLSLPVFDRLNISIIKEMLTNADVKSATLASRYKSPLSTVQRRRTKLERTILKKKYHIDISQLGWREADLMISVDKGNCEEVAKRLLEEHNENVVATSLRIGDPEINIMAKVFYRDSENLHNLIEVIKSMSSVTSVGWAEVVRVVGSNNGVIAAIFGKNQNNVQEQYLQ